MTTQTQPYSQFFLLDNKKFSKNLIVHNLRGFTMDEFEEFEFSPVEQLEWPTTNLRKAIKNIELPKDYEMNDPPEVPLAENTYNVTKDPKGIELATKYRPDIDLRGLELRSEKNSRRWGGLLYRVVADNPDIEQSKNVCIQYIHTWTEQGIFLSRWYHVFAPLMLAILAIWIYSQSFLPPDVFDIPELKDPDRWIPIMEDAQDFFLERPLEPGPLILIIAAILFFVGIWGTFIKPRIEKAGRFSFANSTAFILYAPIFAWTVVLAENERWLIDFAWRWSHIKIRIFDEIYHISPEEQISFVYMSSVIFIGIAILAELLIRWQPGVAHLSHEMDYAPVFVYLELDNKGRWKFDKMRYDRLHYLIGEKTSKEISIKKKWIPIRPYLVIDNNWHSFDTGRPGRIIQILEVIVLIVLAFVGVWQFLLPVEYTRTAFFVITPRWIQILVKIIPFICFLLALRIVAAWSTEIFDDETLVEHRYHLDDHKLRILWNFKPKEPRFVIRKKLQDPFNPDEGFWKDFRD